MTQASEARKPKIERGPRTPKAVLDSAIEENSKWEWLCFVLISVFAATGVAGVVVGIVTDGMWPTIGGSVATCAFTVSLRETLQVWRTNKALRALELSLSDPAEAKATYDVLRTVYRAQYSTGKS